MSIGKLTVIPVDVVLFVGFVAYCLFYNRRELGLIGTFIFVCYLSFIFAKAPFITLGGETSSWVYVFGIAGLGLVCLFLAGFAGKQSEPLKPEMESEEPTESQEEQAESQTELQNQV